VLAISIAGERARFSRQLVDNVAVIDPVVRLSSHAGQLFELLGRPTRFRFSPQNAGFDEFPDERLFTEQVLRSTVMRVPMFTRTRTRLALLKCRAGKGRGTSIS